MVMGLLTLVFCIGGKAGSSLEQLTHNKKSVKQIEIIVAEIFIAPS
jgi:hypothetical protein